ncbi:MAG TPA: hypothetical protein PKJ41_08800 [Bryobacteraceae bacterium]|nr:hypothetical protein [Bryobacteraceae bacterium]HPT28743.1 hypothetical protein [Bryobacteraceae bacterium]
MRPAIKLLAACLFVFPGVCAAQPINLTGNWHLNVEKSKWGNVTKPHSVVLVIDHKEPVLQYQGKVTYSNEDSRDFGYSGAIDGKPYPMDRSFGTGMITVHRVDGETLESEFRSEDGRYVETARTSVSRDGNTLTRRLRLKAPESTQSWTEVYEKR